MPGLAGETANLIVALKLDDSGFSGKLNNAARQLRGMDGALSQMGRGVGQVASGVGRLAERTALLAGAGLGAAITTAISFEDAFAGVAKTVDASDEELATLMDTLRGMAREMPISFEELAGIAESAGALGIATDAIDEFTRTVALIGETTDVTAQDAATSLGVLANILKLREDDFDNFGATLVDLGNKGASTEAQILAIAERSGAGASLIGIAADETLGWASAAANLGIEAEAGGSALQKFFLESLNNLQDNDTLETMAATAGTTADAFKLAFEEDASGALATFIDGLGDLDEASRLDVLDNLGFNDIRIQRLILGLAGDTEMLAETLGIANTAWEENTALQTEAAKRFDTTRSKIDKMVGNLRDVGYVIGNEVIPIVADLSDDLVGWINQPDTQAGIKSFAEDLAGGIRGIADELKGTDFSGILGFAKGAADAAKIAFDLFTSMPKELQQLALAAYGINRLSGGAIGSIARGLGNIAMGGLSALGARGSSPANPVFVSAVGGGLDGPAGKGGGGGILPWLGLAGVAGFELWVAENIGRPIYEELFPVAAEFNELLGQTEGRPASFQLAESQVNALAAELGVPVDELKADMIPLLQQGNLTWEEILAAVQRDEGGYTIPTPGASGGKGPTGTTGTSEWARGLEGVKQTLDSGTSAWAAGLSELKREVATLPDTSMLAPAVNALTQNLPPIRSKADATLAAQYQALQAARGTTSEVSRLANTPHNVSVNNSITIPVSVNTQVVQNQIYRLRMNTGSGGFI